MSDETLDDFDASQDPDALPEDHRSGFIAVIGRPNVGKSTLLNRLLGQKIAITSPKPQTTRDQLLGILTLDDAQMLFLDTPGIHKPQHKLGEYMVQVAADTIDDADVVLWLVDVNVPPTDEDMVIADLLRTVQRRKGKLPPLLLGLNKLDLAGDAAHHTAYLDDRRLEYGALLAWLGDLSGARTGLQSGPQSGAMHGIHSVAFSALSGVGIDDLVAALRDLLPRGPRYYPADQVTDLQTRFIVAELIREQALRLLEQEVPHSLAVVVDEYTERSPELTYIAAVIYVERETQKGIVLGKGGRMIKQIGQAARPEIEGLVGTKVYLDLWVKVWEKWRRREGMLRRLGYATQ
ncbi:MAG: GTPase Era [Chloroflexi bacterium]|nr:MAG: GTPase Era [Chloroflexota bacterium]